MVVIITLLKTVEHWEITTNLIQTVMLYHFALNFIKSILLLEPEKAEKCNIKWFYGITLEINYGKILV